MSDATDNGQAAEATKKSKPKADAQSREYVVYREYAGSEDELRAILSEPIHSSVLVGLATVTAKTAKEARRAVAKELIDDAELRTEQGVALNAIAKSATEVGRGAVRIKVEPQWAD